MDEIQIDFDPEVNDIAERLASLNKTIVFYKNAVDQSAETDLQVDAVIRNLEKEVDFHQARLDKIWKENSGD